MTAASKEFRRKEEIMAEITLTEQNFEEEVMNSDKPVLIDFWATWCGPCMMLSPVISQIAEEQAGKVKVCKVNVDEQPALSQAFHVSSIPMVVLMKDRQIVDTSVGYRSKRKLEVMLAKA